MFLVNKNYFKCAFVIGVACFCSLFIIFFVAPKLKEAFGSQYFLSEDESDVRAFFAEKALDKVEKQYNNLNSLPEGEFFLAKIDNDPYFGKFSVSQESENNGVRSRQVEITVYRKFFDDIVFQKTFSRVLKSSR